MNKTARNAHAPRFSRTAHEMDGSLISEQGSDKTEEPSLCLIWPHTYTERQNKILKIETYLRGGWERILFLTGTDREYIDQILDYTEFAEHDDAPDSAATVCRFFATYRWG